MLAGENASTIPQSICHLPAKSGEVIMFCGIGSFAYIMSLISRRRKELMVHSYISVQK